MTKAEYMRAYRAKHGEKLRAYDREWKRANKQRVSAYNKATRHKYRFWANLYRRLARVDSVCAANRERT